MKVPLVVRTTVLLLVVARLRAVILHHPVAVHVVILLVAAVVLPVLPVEVAALQEVEDNNGDINFKRHLTMKKIITLATLGLLVAAAPIGAQNCVRCCQDNRKRSEWNSPFCRNGRCYGGFGR